MKVRYLQISDLHFQFLNYDTEVMRDKLINYLMELKSKGEFNFLLVTGDIGHRGDNYNVDIKDYLYKIIEGLNLSKKDVHLIPGNHDITRNQPRSLIINQIVKDCKNPSEEIENLQEDTYNLLLNGQKQFFDFYKDFMGIEYPKDDLHFVSHSDNCNILLMNTCLVSHKKGEEGELLINRRKFYKAIKNMGQGSKGVSSLNVAIGHHTLDCLNQIDRKAIMAHFEDYNIDIYMAGHVHDPSYNITSNQSDNPFLELVSGAITADEYAVPGFLVVEVDLKNGDTEANYHIWNKAHQYWTTNNQVGRKTRQDGKLSYTIERLKNNNFNEKEVLEEESEIIDEDEFKQFIVDFHEKNAVNKTTGQTTLENRVELEKKFYDMKCGETFKNKFESYSKYFGVINQIMESTSYVSADKKDLIAEIVIDKYLEFHNHYSNGDEIFIKILSEIHEENWELFPYSKALTKKYVRILICWCIYECEIFNDNKRNLIE
ncbi:metallophosphoesterase family protein [Bacillus sp. FJAT-44742]|uniref:metallophosphoesterase family protein n=1 Tax=Bacillus sp. FJAT-44742 TaxID=2014005 RepID=UPI000C240B66|nr:metallophosphoesterase [Bacillus sp. FJAT-44742]